MSIHAQTEKDGSALITIDGRSQKIKGKNLEDARMIIRDVALNHAARLDKPVTFTSVDPSGEFTMLIHPNGHMEEATEESVEQVVAGQEVEAIEKATPAAPAPKVKEEPVSAPAKETRKDEDTYPSRRSLRETSFLTNDDPIAPATKGVRSWFKFLGIRPQPSAAELSEREDIQAVSQHWPGIRTIAVANRKGGSNKTPTVACLAAVYARYGGGGVLAWDNNENQGTLGWRTEQGTHGASVLDVLRDQELLMSPTATQGLMAGYVHHQTEDKYDVLRSDENDEGDHEIQASEVHEAHAVASRYFRMIVMDSGNTARAANWRAMMEHTDQLVIPTTTMEDRAEAARLTLQTLAARDEHGEKLAREAVVIISQWKAEDRTEAQRIAKLFEPLVRAVVIVPYDPALKAGRIRYEALRPGTQRAWLAAAAAVARGL
ncbi:chromosome partitioning protein ParA [Glutamicibacter sp.]|uniref:MinD/ParA family ATP-binding protein n=1 Tax=Glutamicibacter sp. TaxID=1931995 RepID=UPI003D6A088E